jgi:hypothetical protein
LQQVTRAIVEEDGTAIDMLSIDQQRQVLELSSELLEYQRLKDKGDTRQLESKILRVLRKRSALGGESQTPSGTVEPTERSPHAAHKTTRSRIGYSREFSDDMLDLEVRPAYHDTLDFPAGYTPGFGIDFLNVGFRLREQGGLQLRKVQLLDIESLSPQNEFFSPFSWQFSTGLQRAYIRAGDDALQYSTRLAVGKSWGRESLLLAVMPELEVPVMSHFADGLDVRPGLTITVLRAGERIGLKPHARVFASALYTSDVQSEVVLPLRLTLSTNSALRVEWGRHWLSPATYSSVGVSYDYFW